MNNLIETQYSKNRRPSFRKLLSRSAIKWGYFPVLSVTLLLIIDIGVTILTDQPLMGFALILGFPILLLLCTYPKSIVYALLIYSFIVKFLVSDVGFANIATYVCDGLLVVALFFAMTAQKHFIHSLSFRILGWIVFFFWTIATFSAIMHSVSFGLYFWACRNTFRLFGIMYCCTSLLDAEDIDRLIKFLIGFFFINTLVCTYQHFVLGVGPDNTNGLFGTASGGNAPLNVLLFAMCAFSLFGFLNKQYSAWFLILVSACSLYLAAIAELKFFYFELAALIIFAVLSQKFTFKTVITVALTLTTVIIGIQVLIIFNPKLADFFNLNEIIDYSNEGGYSSAYNLNRLSAIQSLDDRFMHTQIDRLFGLGFGAGQFSQFFISPLYAAYGFLLDWNWFTDAAIFLETGYVGLVLYLLPFIFIAICSLKSANIINNFAKSVLQVRQVNDYTWINKVCASVALLCLSLIFYNATLTTDPGCYFIGCVLSFPFIIKKSVQTSKENND